MEQREVEAWRLTYSQLSVNTAEVLPQGHAAAAAATAAAVAFVARLGQPIGQTPPTNREQKAIWNADCPIGHVFYPVARREGTGNVLPQAHTVENIAPLAEAEYGLGQEQEESERLADQISQTFVLFINTLCSFSRGVPQKIPDPKI